MSLYACALFRRHGGEALKEATDFECSLEQTKLQTFTEALLTSTSIWTLAKEIVKGFVR